ncbi:MAG: hypothetical protein P1V36_02035 [Planctomycetota bacterium]|nr:hypothetical protein [Planctomycetota bacterium]
MALGGKTGWLGSTVPLLLEGVGLFLILHYVVGETATYAFAFSACVVVVALVGCVFSRLRYGGARAAKHRG